MNKLTPSQFSESLGQYHKPSLEAVPDYGSNIMMTYRDSFIDGGIACIADLEGNVIEAWVSMTDRSIPEHTGYPLRWIDPDYRNDPSAQDKTAYDDVKWYEVDSVDDFLRLARLLVERRFSEYVNSIINAEIKNGFVEVYEEDFPDSPIEIPIENDATLMGDDTIEVKLPKEELYALMLYAHDKDITLNQLINQVLLDFLNEQKHDTPFCC